ncbi:MAG: 7,8-didemethyl-8-hydroxy-5-deazariboflavin synthase subunit CofH [Dehalococcoidia bacterium]|nr:7,8-didemethyl-8-hydroxy-5-deazariboflavin synthase subunit CofH [Dehalococcoidia bacterium]MYA52866.1 7,8-didemethyl-8-hydroxy-5-deazariboflavin synthase subunit CofH [Dehalococcoidia bacterium]
MRDTTEAVLTRALAGVSPTHAEALALADETDLASLSRVAGAIRDQAHDHVISYSRNIFIPLTKLCRDVCHYCTFAQPPKRGERAYMSIDEVLEIARAGAAAGCTEALFTLGDKPELRYKVAREELAALGHETTISYLAEVAGIVAEETGLLPHANPGVMTREDIAQLREVSVSQGIMLESLSPRLMEKGQVHYGSPDKDPEARLETMRLAGELQVPFTSGILIGIGETRQERIESLLALRDLHEEHGHIQELIIQNFRAKPDTKMANAPEPDFDDLLWTLAMARILFGPEIGVQAPPNLMPESYGQLVAAGLSDWGGVSPVTIDHVNPEAPWPQLEELRRQTEAAGHHLAERLAVYPSYAKDSDRWQSKKMATEVVRSMDADGFAREGEWAPGAVLEPPPGYTFPREEPDTMPPNSPVPALVAKAKRGEELAEGEIARLFEVRGPEFDYVCAAANELRAEISGDIVRYVVNRNINYTNICYFKCQFCAFSKGKLSENLRGKPYDLGLDEVVRRAREAWDRGATEVCMQGGIHPDYTGETYLQICEAVKDALPDMHVHAFSPLEVHQGAETLGIPVKEFLGRLRDSGLGTLPGTAAEILDDEVRDILCPDKLSTDQWLEVVGAAHEVGFTTTSTVMYGHIDGPVSWARHLLRLRELQARTGGISEFVPLPFVHMEAPIYLKGRARKGPTWREAILMHAVSRLALHPLIPNIQVSWVKMGVEGSKAALLAGANDMGGTLMNESISRAAGASHGQEMPPEAMDELITGIGRLPRQRTTTYGTPPDERQRSSYGADELTPIVLTPVKKYTRSR